MNSVQKKNYCCCSCCTAIVLIGGLICCGIIFACLGVASSNYLYKDLYNAMVKKQLVLKKGSDAYNNWKIPPAPVYMQFYIFNYTNAHDIIKRNAKPRVQQLGPYSYREIRVNEVLTEDNYEITYMTNISYIFDATTSCKTCTENDTFYAPNIPVITVMSIIQGYNIVNPGWLQRLALSAANGVLNSNSDVSLFKVLNVHQLIWGYEDAFLKTLTSFEDLLKMFNMQIPAINPFVALQYNGTSGAIRGGNMTTLTGKKDINDVQQITSWKGNSSLSHWRTKYGNMINGTDGTRFHPFLSRDEQIYIFNNQLCRSMHLNYEKDESVQDIGLLRFSTSEMLFANDTVNPDNYAFCGPKKCWGAGLLEISQCQEGNPPIFISSPHFYQGAQFLIDAIDGLQPQKKLHETYLSIEPVTGIVMDAHKRLQINVLATPSKYFDVMKPIKEATFLPVMFVHEGGSIDKKNADKFKSEVRLPKVILKWLSYGLMIIGGIFALSALLLICMFVRRKKKGNFAMII